ncbi:MAG: 50S ribosomal protein L13, partial [Nanoarchaeota archaeon]
RRIIRGMLPYKKEKGEKAFDRIMCHIGVPKQFEGKKFETLDSANINKRQTVRFMSVNEICKSLGAKV